MITSAAISLSGVVFAGRIAYRLTAAPPERRWAGAGGRRLRRASRVLGIQDYAHYILSAQSDPMIVALCLGAIDCPPLGPAAAGVRARRAGLARPPRGVAVPRPVLDLGLARATRDPLGAGRRLGGDRAAVVRDARPDLAHSVRRRRQRQQVRAAADQQSGVRHDRPLPLDQRAAGGARRAGRASAWRSGAASAPCSSSTAATARLGGDRDRLRPARLAGAGALHVRGRRRS